MGSNETTAQIFPVSAEMADRLVVTALTRKCPDNLISRVEYPNKGYWVTIRFALDTHRIVVFYIPAKGRNETGEIVDGFVFEVAHQGTMIRGIKYANDIFESLIEDATRVAKPIPFVGYQ